jgi:PKHD-type hydroxylase
MILLLSDALSVGLLAELREQITNDSAELHEQITNDSAAERALSHQQRSSVVQALTSHPLFSLGAQPARLSAPRLVMYAAESAASTAPARMPEALREQGQWSGGGEFRGERVRQDLSVTILLSEPSSYAGGELCIDTGCGEEAYKPAAGTAIVAPASARWRVAPVLRGSRWALELGAQSLVREEGQREILYDVGCSLELLDVLGDALGAKRTREIESLRCVHRSLLRLWAEP